MSSITVVLFVFWRNTNAAMIVCCQSWLAGSRIHFKDQFQGSISRIHFKDQKDQSRINGSRINFNPISCCLLIYQIRNSCHHQNSSTVARPDITVKQKNQLVTLELKICHETNVATSRDFKVSKNTGLKQDLLPELSNYKISNHTIEITSLGFISDCASFTKQINTHPMPNSIKQAVFKSTVSDSYAIYCSRNSDNN